MEDSGGDVPVSVDTHKGLLYVLNEISGTISGFRYDSRGNMTPIPDSTESLSTPGADGVAAQIGFDRTGRVLTVTQRLTDVVDTFVLGADGTPGPATANASNAPTPFGFAYDARNHLIVANVGTVGPDPGDPAHFNGSGSSYTVSGSGALTAIDNAAAGGRATCWTIITNNSKYAYMTNTLSHTVSRFRIAPDGQLTLLGTTETTSPAGLANDPALSRNSKYLYVLSSMEGLLAGQPPATSSIDVYRVGADGGLTHVQSTPSNLPVGTSGLAAR